MQSPKVAFKLVALLLRVCSRQCISVWTMSTLMKVVCGVFQSLLENDVVANRIK